MSAFFRHFARYAMRKAAANPEVQAKAAEAARYAVEEAKEVARGENRAHAAGRAVRRALDKLKGEN